MERSIYKYRSRLLHRTKDQSSFTLIELLIVIAIIGILAATVVIVLNPTQLLAQSRDSARIQDLADINTAIKQYLADGNTNLGTSSVVYVSIPDTNSSCSDLGLPALPTGWSYHCVQTTTLTHTNGTGWIPLQFSSVTTGNPLPTLPIDPLNTTSTGEFYTYATNGTTYELTSYFESNNYQTQATQSGNPDPTAYALGSNLSLTPFIHGLVGYWPLNEGAGTTAYDKSGWGNSGTLEDTTTTESNVGPTWTTSGCLNGGSCLSFDGVGDYVGVNDSPELNIPGDVTLVYWVSVNGLQKNHAGIVTHRGGASCGMLDYASDVDGGGDIRFNYWNGSSWYDNSAASVLENNSWQMVAVSRNLQFNTINYYVNGNLVGSTTALGLATGNSSMVDIGTDYGFGGCPGTSWFNGKITNAMIFNSSLSSAQIQSIYNVEKA